MLLSWTNVGQAEKIIPLMALELFLTLVNKCDNKEDVSEMNQKVSGLVVSYIYK